VKAKTEIRHALISSVTAFLSLGCCAGSLAQILESDRSRSTAQPVPRTDVNSRRAHEQLVEQAKKGGIDVYFVGDSITRRWGCADRQYRSLLENWHTNFFGWNAADFGWGADRIENILWRLENGELDGLKPKVIVIQAGINNIGRQPADAEKIVDITLGLKTLLNLCRTKVPDATVILTAIFPRSDAPAVLPTVHQINLDLASLADGKKVRFVNINPKLLDENGKVLPGMLNSDGLHPTVKTYQIWADALKPIFMELLGPPAKTDHAPPPTADPASEK